MKIGYTMMRMVSLSMLGAIMAVTLSTSFAQAEDRRERGERREARQVCSIVKRCRLDDGRRRCVRERVCRTVRRDRD
jgi:hypothetical protein